MQEEQVTSIFTQSWFLSQVLGITSLEELLKQRLQTTDSPDIQSTEEIVQKHFKNVLSFDQKATIQSSEKQKEEEKELPSIMKLPYKRNLKEIAKLLMEYKNQAPPIQLYGYRSTLGHDKEYTDKYEVYNLGTGDFSKSFCSEKPGPGCFQLLPYVYNNFEYEAKAQEYLEIMDKEYHWYSSQYAAQQLAKFKQKLEKEEIDLIVKAKILQNLAKKQGLEKENEESFNKWLMEIEELLQPILELIQQPKIEIQEDCKTEETHVVKYDASTASQAMDGLQLLLCGFYLKLSHGYSCNLKNFAIVLHDVELEIQNTKIYEVVSKWKTQGQVKDFEEEESKYIIKRSKMTQNDAYFVQYFQRQPRSQKVRLLCWAETYQKIGDFYFSLPKIECTKYMSIIGIDHHNHYKLSPDESNIDIRKFMGAGFLISTTF